MKYLITFFITALLACASIGFYAYLYVSVNGYLSTIATLKEEASSAGQREAIRRAQDIFLSENESSRTEVQTFMTRDSDIVHVIETIEAAGRREKVQVSIGSVVVEAIPDKQHHERVRVALSARGTFPSLGAFATALETFPIASQLSGVELEASTNNLWFGTYTFTLIKEKGT